MKDYKVTCIHCEKEYVSIGKYFEDHYKNNKDEYVCLGCKAKEKK
jgi:hypothetical protein